MAMLAVLAYVGWQLARDSLDLLSDAQRKIEDAIATLEDQVESDDADPIDLYKLQTYAAELYAKQAEAQRYERVALAGLRFYTGVPNLAIAGVPPRPRRHPRCCTRRPAAPSAAQTDLPPHPTGSGPLNS